MSTRKQLVVQPDGNRVQWPWKTGQRATFPRTGEQVTLHRVEPPTLGVRYQLRHRSIDNQTLRPYRWRGRAWTLAALMELVESGRLVIEPMPRRKRSRGKGSPK